MTPSNSPPGQPQSATPSRLAVVIRQLTRNTVLDALESGCLAVRRVATEWLTRIPPEDATGILTRGIERSDSRCLAILRALKHPELELSESLWQRIVARLDRSDEVIRRAIAELVVLRRPEEATRLLLDSACRQDMEVLRTLCRADDPALILPLMMAFGFPQRRPPPTIGFLVTPAWLGEHHSQHPAEVEWLIRECGYCDEPVTPDVLDLLSLGLWLVATPMSSTGPADIWLQRQQTLVWRLLPESDDATRRDTEPVNLQDPIDTALFLSAVRETDRHLFVERQSRPPHALFTQTGAPSPVCFHAHARHVRRLFLTEAKVLAQELGLADADLASFVVDYARVTLETVSEVRIAADRRLRTKWLIHRSWPTQPASVSETRGNRRPSRFTPVVKPVPARRLVIGDFVATPPDPTLSPGAQSICQLATLAGLDSDRLGEWLTTCERRWSGLVAPVGIELQIPKVDPNRFGGWKDALPYLGISSPDRPEFGGMVEAALRPARSFHAVLLAPVLLRRLGLISPSEPQDIAMHISLQGDLGNPSRYIAFPQLCIHPSQRLKNRPDSAMTRVMSKGFIHCNRDIEHLDHDGHTDDGANVRTEFRMFRVFSDDGDSATKISASYVEDLVATQLMGSAMIASCQTCRDLAADYCREIDDRIAQLPAAFAQLLHGNFYESTGDPRDELLMQQLPIFRAWSDVRHHVRDHNQQAELDQTFRGLRSRHVEALSNHLRADHGVDVSEDLKQCADWGCPTKG
ncbi:MAG: hypothetical protein JSS49_20665 [Planctomycetes bacterium]|nr:hypothetical protein [Planctomycetota bacterium]